MMDVVRAKYIEVLTSSMESQQSYSDTRHRSAASRRRSSSKAGDRRYYCRANAMTLVELLVVIGIVGILLALMLPAVQAARESARQAQCRNHLKQLGTAVLLHHEAHRRFPTDGWGLRWVGDPDRGFGAEQPGGWIYNITPFIEESALRASGQGLAAENKRRHLGELQDTPIEILHCPSRRPAAPYAYTAGNLTLRNAETPAIAAKTDYAINGGDFRLDGGQGPKSAALHDVREYKWPNTSQFNGIAFVRSMIRAADVMDGTTHTYLLGEKYVSGSEYESGKFEGDDQSAYIGDDTDIRRWTLQPPVYDREGSGSKSEFGSAHRGKCHFVFCDGSVRDIAYHIPSDVHRRLGNRRDGEIISYPEL